MLPPALACLLTAALLSVVHLKVDRPMLLAERFFPGWGGPAEIAILSLYAALLCRGLLDPRTSARWRRAAWWIFSLAFFAQFALGLAGVERCLMRPEHLHLPVPALIAAGPLYRLDRFFMIILFLCTVLLVGPAWCSHLCYLGVWDQEAALRKKKPGRLPAWHQRARVIITALVLGAALTLGLAGAPAMVAALAALAFGLIGVAVMLLWSRRAGVMVHCVVYCPIGLLAVWLGKLSPFRLRLSDGCDGCMRCRPSCRFAALEKVDVERRRPGMTCTLCGDCLSSCDGGFLEYRFAGLSPRTSRALFVVLVSALMACILGVARI